MKKILTIASLMCCIYMAEAQQTTPKKPDNKKAGQNTTTNNANSNTAQDQNTANQGTNTTGTDVSGAMTSTGRYAAMGVQTGSLHRKDAKFVVLAVSSNNLELQLSQLALQKASSQAVKDFANMMVQHHTMAAKEMKDLLSKKGAVVPDSALLPVHRLQLETVMAAEGAEFDKAYMRIMVDAHEEDVDEFEDETTDARDADVRAFATRMLPTLQTHYARAKEVRRQIK